MMICQSTDQGHTQWTALSGDVKMIERAIIVGTVKSNEAINRSVSIYQGVELTYVLNQSF
jgi:hypothetical protein